MRLQRRGRLWNTSDRERAPQSHDVAKAIAAEAQPRCYDRDVAEIGLAFLLIPVLIVADPRRLQTIMDRVRELLVWLAE